ncbi:MAG: type II toxin-antitoxin system PemK/MazF family toxin [Ekhidna sp.]
MDLIRNKFEVWLADLGIKDGSEVGKVRPVVIVQSSFLSGLPSTIVCPITFNPWEVENSFQIPVKSGESGLLRDSLILTDQLRSLDNSKLRKKIGELNLRNQITLDQRLKVTLDLT